MRNNSGLADQLLSSDERAEQRDLLRRISLDPKLMPIMNGNRLWYVMDRRTCGPAPQFGPAPSIEMLQERMLARFHAEADEAPAHKGVCYFIGGADGAIKIGYSIDVKSRLAAIQMCSPVVLSVLATAPGGASREAAYHHQFRDIRLHGEWFDRHPDILAEIDRLNLPQACGGSEGER